MTADEILTLVRVRRLLASGEARQMRESRDVPIAPIAEAIGVDPSMISRWERGENIPRDHVKALAYARLLDALAAA